MRKLVAALACRNDGSRLYGKPLQNLDIAKGVTILGHMVDLIATLPEIHDTVLGIADGEANLPFVSFARCRALGHIIGDENDVLMRLIQCCRHAQGTDIFRVTTESPFFYFEKVEEAWNRHRDSMNDVTVVDGLPEGSHFEIYTLEALEKSHALGDDRHRSEYCSLYLRENRSSHRVEVIPTPPEVERMDLRLTVDYPEDLVLCRGVYAHLRHLAPRIPISDIISFLDAHPELTTLVKPYVVPERVW